MVLCAGRQNRSRYAGEDGDAAPGDGVPRRQRRRSGDAITLGAERPGHTGHTARGLPLPRRAEAPAMRLILASLLSLAAARACAAPRLPSADAPPVTRSQRLRRAGQAGAAARLSVFPLRQPERAQGRHGHPRLGRHLRQLQPVHPARHRRWRHRVALGDPARRLRLGLDGRPCLGNAADLLRRRRRRRLLPPGADHRGSRRPHVGRLRAPAGGEILRRHAGHRRGHRLDLPHPADPGPAQLPHPDGRREGRGGGKPTPRGVPLRHQHQPAIAADPRRAAGAAGALVQGPRLHPPAAGRADRLRPLPHHPFRTRPQRHLRARSQLVGRETADRIGTNNFDRVQVEYFRDFDRGDGGVQGRLDRRAQREHFEELGHRL